MTYRIKVGKKSQIVIPVEFRRAVGIKAGEDIIMDVVDNAVVIHPCPKSFSEKLKGLHKEVWSGTDPLDFVMKERESW